MFEDINKETYKKCYFKYKQEQLEAADQLAKVTSEISRALTSFFNGQSLSDLIWDVRLLYSEDDKKIIQKSILTDETKILILSSSLPKYLWVATCMITDFSKMDITFDATNVSNGMICNGIVNYLPDDVTQPLIQFIDVNLDYLLTEDFIKHRLAREYFAYFLKVLRKEHMLFDSMP